MGRPAFSELGRGKYLSVSRMKLYENCPLAFKMRYVTKVPQGPSSEPAEFGKLVHEALENVYNWVLNEEFSGKIPDEVILDSYRKAFESPKVDVVSNALYTEGLELTRTYFRQHPEANHRDVLAVELEFRIRCLGEYDAYGFIDRVDRVDHNTVEIIDYKTNRMLFSRDELDSDLQMSVYGLAVKSKWPWVKNVRYRFDMIRHAMSLYTSREDDELDETVDYIVSLGRRLDALKKYPAKVNPLCNWCDYRDKCKPFKQALEGDGLSMLVATDDIERIADERNRAAAIEKIAKGRKYEMDDILKVHLDKAKGEELVAAGYKYRLQTNFETKYSAAKTLAALHQATGISLDKLSDEILVVDAKKIDAVIRGADLPRSKQQLLKVMLESIADRAPKRPFVSARKAVKRK